MIRMDFSVDLRKTFIWITQVLSNLWHQQRNKAKLFNCTLFLFFILKSRRPPTTRTSLIEILRKHMKASDKLDITEWNPPNWKYHLQRPSKPDTGIDREPENDFTVSWDSLRRPFSFWPSFRSQTRSTVTRNTLSDAIPNEQSSHRRLKLFVQHVAASDAVQCSDLSVKKEC